MTTRNEQTENCVLCECHKMASGVHYTMTSGAPVRWEGSRSGQQADELHSLSFQSDVATCVWEELRCCNKLVVLLAKLGCHAVASYRQQHLAAITFQS